MDKHLQIADRSGSRQQREAPILAVALVAAVAVCLGCAHIPVGGYSRVLPAFGAVGLVAAGMAAGLLLTQCRWAGGQGASRLGAAYLYSALLMGPRLLAALGLLNTDGEAGLDDVGLWLACAWHAGFALCVVWFVAGPGGGLQPGRLSRVIAGSVLAAACVIAGLLAGSAWLPAGVARALMAGGVGPLTLVVLPVACTLIVTSLPGRPVLKAWLAATLLAAFVDTALTLGGTGRLTVGWCAAQALDAVCSLGVLVALTSELIGESGRVAAANAQLTLMLQTDVLTGLANRRAFETALDAEWRRAQREQTAMSLLMVDIDSFKTFNDRYGHPAGDGCLRVVGNALASQALRPGDVAARIGGEEFGIILPVTEEAGAMQVAERLRASVASRAVPHAGSGSGRVTISIGTATIRPYMLPGEAGQLVAIADAALYRAKAAGRDTIRGSECPVRLLSAA